MSANKTPNVPPRKGVDISNMGVKKTAVKSVSNKEDKNEMVFSWDNYKWMLIGFVVIIIGFVLMAGGGSDDPNVFRTEEIFSWRRISLAPFVVLVGFGIVGYSIFRKKKDNKSND